MVSDCKNIKKCFMQGAKEFFFFFFLERSKIQDEFNHKLYITLVLKGKCEAFF
jgi:hypothetical protein